MAVPCLGWVSQHEQEEACYTVCMRCWCLCACLSMSLLRNQLSLLEDTALRDKIVPC